jgi:hypothetical protein
MMIANMYVIYKPTPRFFDKSSAVEVIRNRFLHNMYANRLPMFRIVGNYAKAGGGKLIKTTII